jgi:tRNA (guanine10-N2)-methyltransferase
LISRAILSDSVYHLWGLGSTYPSLHESVHDVSSLWRTFKNASFRFKIHSFNHKRPQKEQVGIIEGFAYLGLDGVIDMKKPDEEFTVLEEFNSPHPPKDGESKQPERIYFGRLIANSGRFDAIGKYDLKKRRYIDTTSMDAELALVTANMAHAQPGKIFWDPFAGTGGFLVTAAHFGAMVLGSDIDGRALRGKDPKARANFIEPKRGPKRKVEAKRQWNVFSNFEQYGLMSKWLDGFSADVTNTPVRGGGAKRWVDGMMCDPPYGIREGLRVLGWRKAEDHVQSELHLLNGKPAYLDPSYVPPKRPYSFDALLADILDLAAELLVDNGRLAMWMPAANTEVSGQPSGDEVEASEGVSEVVVEYTIPQNRYLRLSSASVQPFNKCKSTNRNPTSLPTNNLV